MQIALQAIILKVINRGVAVLFAKTARGFHLKYEYEYLDLGENCKNTNCHDPAKDMQEDRSDALSSPRFSSPASKPGTRSKLAGVDQLFLFFIMVKTWHITKTYSLALLLPDTSLHGLILFTSN